MSSTGKHRGTGTAANWLVVTAKRYNSIRGSLMARGLSFNLVIGLLPLFFFMVSSAAIVFNVAPRVSELLFDEFLSFLPRETLDSIEGMITLFAGRWESLGIFTIGIFLVTAYFLFEALETVITTAMGTERRSFGHGRLINLSLMLGSILFFYAASTLSLGVRLLIRYQIVSGDLFPEGAKLLSIIISSIIFIVLYRVFARRKLKAFPALLIAFLASTIWQVVQYVGTILIQLAGRRFIIYGALAGSVIYLIFMRILAEIIVISSLLIRFFCLAGRTVQPGAQPNE